jgi:hypothetical protein
MQKYKKMRVSPIPHGQKEKRALIFNKNFQYFVKRSSPLALDCSWRQQQPADVAAGEVAQEDGHIVGWDACMPLHGGEEVHHVGIRVLPVWCQSPSCRCRSHIAQFLISLQK